MIQEVVNPGNGSGPDVVHDEEAGHQKSTVEVSELKKDLRNRHMQMIAIGTSFPSMHSFLIIE